MLTEENIANRKKGIGASECAIIFGLNEHISPYHLWMIKTGLAQWPDLSNVPQVEWGNRLEDVIAKKYEDETGRIALLDGETRFHVEHPFILCHLDRLILDGVGDKRILECKFSMGFTNEQWGAAGTTEVPEAYILQVQHQLAVTGYQFGDLAVLISGWDFRIYHFERDEELISVIVDRIKEFWWHVENKTPPPLRDMSDAKLAWPFSVEKHVIANDSVVDAWQKLKSLREQQKHVEKEINPLKDDITLYMQDAEALITEKSVLATWKSNKAGNRVLLIKE